MDDSIEGEWQPVFFRLVHLLAAMPCERRHGCRHLSVTTQMCAPCQADFALRRYRKWFEDRSPRP